MTVVVDASVACKWFVDEPGSDEAVRLLAQDEGLIAPDLLVPEVCDTVWKKRRNGEMSEAQAAAAIGGLSAFLDDLVPTAPLARQAFAMAERLSHPVYDLFYLALAESRDARLVTADRRLLARLAGTPWAALAQDLHLL